MTTLGPGDSLAERIRRGDENAFEEFRTQYSAPFYYYFRHRGLPQAAAIDLAGDCVTDIPLKVQKHFNPGHTSFEAWVNLLRQRAASDWWRSQKHVQIVELTDRLATPADEDIDDEIATQLAVRDALSTMEPLDQELLRLRYGGQVPASFLEIAVELSQRHGKEFKEATIRQRHARALSKLRTLLCRDSRLTELLERLDRLLATVSEQED